MSDDVIGIILNKLDKIADKLDKTMEKVTTVEAKEKEKDKQCEKHNENYNKIEGRVSALEKLMYKFLGAIVIINFVATLAVQHFFK